MYGLVEFVVAIDAEEECTEGVDVELDGDEAGWLFEELGSVLPPVKNPAVIKINTWI